MTPTATPTRRPWLRAVGFLVGFVLLAAAVAAVFTRADPGWTDALRNTPPASVALLVLLPLVNVAINAECFRLLLLNQATVPRHEMNALIASSWLLNHLPLRPGLLGRVAYHHAVHGIRPAASARAVIESIIIGVMAFALFLASVYATIRLATPLPAAAALLALAAPLGAMQIQRLRATSSGTSPHASPPRAATYLAVLLLKVADHAVWWARYAIACSAVGLSVSPLESAALAAVAQAAMLIPLAGNGLGLREWAVATALAAGASDRTLAASITPDLLNRAAEIFAALAAGIPASLYLAARLRRKPGRN